MNTHAAPAPDKIIAEVAAQLLLRGRQLVTAESCTGGWVAKRCTDQAGSSRWYRGGVVAYTNDLKTSLLGVPARTLAEQGAVSEATVRAMAAGALDRLGGDVAVAVSGIAGPDGAAPGKPVGTVWFAWAVRSAGEVAVEARMHRLEGDRDRVRRQAVELALQGVLDR